MIIRVDVELDAGTLKYQRGNLAHVTQDATYLKTILESSDILQCGNFGEGWEVGTFSFTVEDLAGTLRASTAVWHGKPVIVKVLSEEYNTGSEEWELVEAVYWKGAVTRRVAAGYGRYAIDCTENHGLLGATIPLYTINSAEYPAAKDTALGQPIQTLAGIFNLSGGAVVAWNVGNGLYLLAQNTVVACSEIFADGVSIPQKYWGLITDAAGRSYIRYTPPTGIDGISEDETDSIYCNVTGTTSENPVDCLKTTLDAALGTDVFFTGAAAVKSEMTTRGYKASICASMGDKVGDLITEFCANFGCFATIGTDGKLSLAYLSATPTAALDNSDIFSGSESEEPGEGANSVKMSWGYDFPGNRFAFEDSFIHQDSIDIYGRQEASWDYFLTRDPDTAIDATRRRMRQVREMPRRLMVTVNFEAQQDIAIGDVITVESDFRISSGSASYQVVKKSIKPDDDTVDLFCVSYLSGMDYIVKVTKNFDGGTVDPMGLMVVSAGDDLTVAGTAYDYHTLVAMVIDLTTVVDDDTDYTFSNIDADHEIAFQFRADRFPILASDDGFGVISPKGQVMVESGANQTFYFTPNSGKAFSKWWVDGVESTTYPYVFSSVSAPHTIAAVSTSRLPSLCKVTTTVTGAGKVSPVPNAPNTVHIGWYQYGYWNNRSFDRPANVTINGTTQTGVMFVRFQTLIDTTVAVVFP